MTKFAGFLDGIERELAQLNDHLPRTKKSLAQLLSEPDPAFLTRDGQASGVRREELEYLAELIPPQLHAQVMLPFMILRRTSLGRGAFTIGGSKLDQFTILKIIGRVTAPFESWQETELPRCIYSPELVLLRKRLASTVAIGFGV
jgi:uncharacterized protein (UPF0216 family)